MSYEYEFGVRVPNPTMPEEEQVILAARSVALGVPKEEVVAVLGMCGLLEPLSAIRKGQALPEPESTDLFIPNPGQPGGFIDPHDSTKRAVPNIFLAPRRKTVR